MIYGEVDIENDTICWFQKTGMTFSILAINGVLSMLTIICFVKMNLVIKATFLTMPEDEMFLRYKSRLTQFFIITVSTFILTISCIFPFIDSIKTSKYDDFFIYLEDYFDCILYPLFAITYCYNKDKLSMIINILCCNNDDDIEYIQPSLILFTDDSLSSSQVLNETHQSLT